QSSKETLDLRTDPQLLPCRDHILQTLRDQTRALRIFCKALQHQRRYKKSLDRVLRQKLGERSSIPPHPLIQQHQRPARAQRREDLLEGHIKAERRKLQ